MTEEVKVLTIEESIKIEIAKFDPFEKRIAELKEQYSGLTIDGINDKEGYENVRVAIGELRSIRTGTEKDKKTIKKPFLDACTTIEEKSKWIIAEVSKIEDPLQAKKDVVDAEKEKIKAEKKAAQEKTFIQRSMQLSNMGVLFDGTNFILEDASYEGVLVREADEDVYNEFILPKFKVIFDKHEAIRLEEERVKAEQVEKDRLEREEFARQQEELRKQQALIEEQKAEAEKERQELIRKQKEKEDAEILEKEREKQELQSKRLAALLPYNKYGEDVDMATLWVLSQSHFDTLLSDKKAAYEKAQAEIAENNRIENEKKVKLAEEAAAKKERERIEAEQKENEVRRIQEEERKAEELAKAGDKANWDAYVAKIRAIQKPTVKSGQYRKIAAIAAEKIEEILNLKAQ